MLSCEKNRGAFSCTVILISVGKPQISWEPRLSEEEEAKRTYTIEGRFSLTEGDWNELRMENGEWRIGECRFFRVKVEMP